MADGPIWPPARVSQSRRSVALGESSWVPHASHQWRRVLLQQTIGHRLTRLRWTEPLGDPVEAKCFRHDLFRIGRAECRDAEALEHPETAAGESDLGPTSRDVARKPPRTQPPLSTHAVSLIRGRP